MSSGGGATHIAKIQGKLSDIGYDSFVINQNGYIVAGGGGGSTYNNNCVSSCDQWVGYMIGGSGGGYMGGDVYGTVLNTHISLGATQTAGGQKGNRAQETGSFGLGAGAVNSDTCGGWPNYCIHIAGGGGGLYGGGNSWGHGAGGGSGYIGNSLLTNKKMYCYECQESTEENTKTISTTCKSATPTINCAKQGNGYSRIIIEECSI